MKLTTKELNKAHRATINLCNELDMAGSISDEYDLYATVWEIYKNKDKRWLNSTKAEWKEVFSEKR